MSRRRLSKIVKLAMLVVGYAMCALGQNPRFTNDEVKPLLDAVSKLHEIVVVKQSPYSNLKWPHICWIDAEPFKPLDKVVDQYSGAGRWLFVKDLPRRCLIVQPDLSRGEPLPIDSSSRTIAAEELDQVAAVLEKRKIIVPWKTSSFTRPDEFRTAMAREIPQLAIFIEQELGLEGKSSLGIQYSDQDLRLSLMVDHDGPGSGVVLVADPIRFSTSHSLTSTNDRILHFWITDEEALGLWSEISKAESEGHDAGWPLLSKVAEAKYGGLVVLPSEVAELASECVKMKLATQNPDLFAALDRILSVCRSAQSYNLGIYLPGQ